jgi:hypothetical protein
MVKILGVNKRSDLINEQINQQIKERYNKDIQSQFMGGLRPRLTTSIEKSSPRSFIKSLAQ